MRRREHVQQVGALEVDRLDGELELVLDVEGLLARVRVRVRVKGLRVRAILDLELVEGVLGVAW